MALVIENYLAFKNKAGDVNLVVDVFLTADELIGFHWLDKDLAVQSRQSGTIIFKDCSIKDWNALFITQFRGQTPEMKRVAA